jgi:hypothetical protein
MVQSSRTTGLNIAVTVALLANSAPYPRDEGAFVKMNSRRSKIEKKKCQFPLTQSGVLGF